MIVTPFITVEFYLSIEKEGNEDSQKFIREEVNKINHNDLFSFLLKEKEKGKKDKAKISYSISNLEVSLFFIDRNKITSELEKNKDFLNGKSELEMKVEKEFERDNFFKLICFKNFQQIEFLN